MDYEPGDIFACYGSDHTSRFISSVTASIFAPVRLRFGPSHVAMMCAWQNEPHWVESTTLCPHPCRVHQKLVEGPQSQFPEQRIQDYLATGGRVDLYRLTPINRLTAEESQLLSHLLIQQFVAVSTPYDLPGALLSGTRLLSLTRLFPQADLQSLFCSELIAAVLMRLNRMNHANPARFHPARLLRTLVDNGTYQFVESPVLDEVLSAQVTA